MTESNTKQFISIKDYFMDYFYTLSVEIQIEIESQVSIIN